MRRLATILLALVLMPAVAVALTLQSRTLPPTPLPAPATQLYPYVQTFTACIPDPSVLVGQASFIWSTGGGGTATPGCQPGGPGPDAAPITGVSSGYYWPLIHNNINVNGFDLTWFYNNHPDWVAYECDRTTPAYLGVQGLSTAVVNGSPVLTPSAITPSVVVGGFVLGAGLPDATNPATITAINNTTGTVRISTNFTGTTGTQTVYFTRFQPNDVPLVFPIPAVQQFIEGYIDQAKTLGFAGMNFDLATAYNNIGECGYYAGATPGGGSSPSFGGTWVQLWSGAKDDQQYSDQKLAWARRLTQYAHGDGLYTVGNVADVGFTADNSGSNSFDYLRFGAAQQMQTSFDIQLQESIYAECKNLPTPCQWLTDAAYNTALKGTIEQAKISPLWLIQYPPCTAAGQCWGVAGVTINNGGTGFTASPPCQVSLTNGVTIQVTAVSGSAATAAQAASGSTNTQSGALSQSGASTCGGTGLVATLTYGDYQAEFIADFLLARPDPALFPPAYRSVIGFATDHAKFVPADASWAPAMGSPTGDAFLDSVANGGGGCWLRNYTNGMVAVNSSSTTTCSFTAIAGFDVHGNPVPAGSTSLAPRGSDNLNTSIVIVK